MVNLIGLGMYFRGIQLERIYIRVNVVGLSQRSHSPRVFPSHLISICRWIGVHDAVLLRFPSC